MLCHFCSSLGQNLQTSNYVWENCFAIFISLFGLMLFLSFIENLKVNPQFFLFCPFLFFKRFGAIIIIIIVVVVVGGGGSGLRGAGSQVLLLL